MDCGNVPPRPREGGSEGAPACMGVGEASVACCVAGSPNDPVGTVVDVDGVDDAEDPRDGVEGRLGIGVDVDVDGEEEEGGGKNGDFARRPRGASTGEGDGKCCVDGE